jgi:mono/diheme cytochrome c family protein
MKLKIILKKFIQGAILLFPVLLITNCKKEASRPLSVLETKGKGIYMANCTACHNPDPRLTGSVGPEIAGPSLELITARVLYQSYPAGYRPKRKSKLMPPLPFLVHDIPALHAYLNSFQNQKVFPKAER